MDLGLNGPHRDRLRLQPGPGARVRRWSWPRAGCRVVINGRDAETPGADAADELAAETGAEIIPVVADVSHARGPRSAARRRARSPTSWSTTTAGRRCATSATSITRRCWPASTPTWRRRSRWSRASSTGWCERRFGRIVNITSGSVKMPLTGLDLSSGARVGPDRLPRRRGPLGRPRQRHDQLPAARRLRHRPAALQQRGRRPSGWASRSRRSPSAAAATIPARRFGEPAEFGAACAFLLLGPGRATSPARAC